MITAQYKRDLNHNYLILPAAKETAKAYQLQMIAKNKIEGLLSCQVKITEDGMDCYYEISSRQSLQHIFMTSEMNYTELKNLLIGIYLILQRLDGYLLESQYLVLEPEYIYMEAEQGKVWLTYLPGYEGGSFAGIKHLAEFVLSKVNHKDEQAAELAYYLYQYTKEENFSFCHLADYIENQGSHSGESVQEYAPEHTQENAYERTQENVYEDKRAASWEVIQNRILFLCLAGTILIIAIGVYILMNYQLELREKVIGAGMTAIFYAAAAMIYMHYRKQEKGSSVKHDTDKTWEKHSNQREESIDRKSEAYSTEWSGQAEVCSYMLQNENEETEEEDYGNTVFFGGQPEAGGHYIEGECRGSTIHYRLDKMQITVGKMQDKVDIRLNDTSVSRIHAAVYQKGDKYFLTDLNSTNGTYKNSVPLQGGEMVELEPGDELRFGKVCLTYH